MMDRARARAAIQASGKVMPLAMTLIEAAAKQGANILELQDACSLVIAMFRDVLKHTSAASVEFESKAKAAAESIVILNSEGFFQSERRCGCERRREDD